MKGLEEDNNYMGENISFDNVHLITENEKKEYYKLSHPQLSIWYGEKIYPGTNFANIAETVTIIDDISFRILEKAINLVIMKNDGLRLRIEDYEGEPRQYISKYRYIAIETMDFSQYGGKDSRSSWGELKEQSVFKLNNSDLFYFAMFKLSDNEGGFYAKFHHLICDAWTIQNLITSKIVEYYYLMKNGLEVETQAKPSYIDYIISEENYKKTNKFLQHKEYWAKKFETIPEVTCVKHGSVSPGKTTSKRNSFRLSRELMKEIENYCNATKNSPFALFLSVLAIYLSKITGKNDVVIGTPLLNRSSVKEKGTVGMFIKMVPVRLQIQNKIDFNSFVDSVTNELNQVFRNKNYPYDYILKDFRERHKSSDNLYDVVLSFQNAKHEKLELDYKVDWHFTGNIIETLAFHITDINESGQYDVDIDFLVDYFNENEIRKMFDHFINILSRALRSYSIKVSDLDMLAQEETKKQLVDFNDSRTGYPRDKTIPQLFVEQVKKAPENIAIEFGSNQLSYVELDRRSNQLAGALIKIGVERNGLIGIIIDRSIDMIIAIMGVLKAGGAYVPIDPQYPIERVKGILRDSQTKILLTDSVAKKGLEYDLIEVVDELQCKVLLVDEPMETLAEVPIVNIENTCTSEDFVYVMYTSGSTGKPKGNLTTHYNIVRVVKDTNYIEIDENDTILQLSNYAFDGSTFDIYGALLNGAKLVIIDRETVIDVFKLSRIIENSGITKFFVTTALFNTLVDVNISCLKNVKKILFGGERVSVHHVKKAFEYLGKNRLIHVYGPTESTVFATYYHINEIDDNCFTIPIGKPVSNTRVYILDNNQRLQPIGYAGEICISGDGLVKGYLNNEELTAERFVPNPYQQGEIIYRTGDLAKWLPDGNIEFLDRMDNQVKLRGYRIELGEIESRVLEFDGISEAIVILREDDGSRYLCAYYTADVNISTSKLKEHLLKKLPDFMVPAHFIQLSKMPLNTSGKINKDELPKPDPGFFTTTEYVEPENEIQKKLIEIFEAVLGVENVGISHNFFDLGGDSLEAITLLARIHKIFGTEISITQLFKAKTVGEISKIIGSANTSECHVIEKVKDMEFYPAAPAQKRMYILYNMDSAGVSYNVPFGIRIKGEMNIELLQYALNKLVERHEALRTTFHSVNGEIIQRVHQSFKCELEETNIDESQLIEEERNFIKAFKLDKLPLFRVKLVRLQTCEYVLFFDIHHIISDGTTLGILLNELSAIYNGVGLSNVHLQYKDYSKWINERISDTSRKSEEEYWLKQFSGEIPLLSLPLDHKRPAAQSCRGDRVRSSLDTELIRKINTLNERTCTTKFMFFLACFNVLLSKYSSQEDIIVGTPVAGRNHNQLADVVGMFVNTLALRNYPSGNITFNEFLEAVKFNSLNAFENQNYQFEELVNKLNLQRDMGRNPLFDVMFVMQNFETPGVDLINLECSFYGLEFNVSKFDIMLQVFEDNTGIKLEFEYRTELFERETIERMVKHFINILHYTVDNPAKALHTIDMVSIEEKKQMLLDFNTTYSEYPRDKAIHLLFEEQAAENPAGIAVVCKDKMLTYCELNKKANTLAVYLREKGVKPDSIVAIVAERSIEMVIGTLAILKAGGAYLPINPDYPEERIKHMIRDCDTQIALTGNSFDKCNLEGITQINIADYAKSEYQVSDLENLNNSRDLAYIMYTSGSTGGPKGVMVEHRSVVRLVRNTNYIDFHKSDRILQTGAVVFDASTFEIWGALLNGLSLYIVDENTILNANMLNDALKQYNITTLWVTSPLFNQLSQEKPEMFSGIRNLLVGGDILSPKHINQVREHCKGIRIINGYGPTENTTFSTCHIIDRDYTDSIPIGRPISNSTAYIFDRHMNIVPIGVPGELFVGGEGVARGYLSNENLTGSKFIENPYKSNEIIYKTGDLAKWLPDGTIEFIGRIDKQVKIRGFRVELGEIENHILKNTKIKEAIVIVKQSKSGGKHLCAYFTSVFEISFSEIRNELLKNLPEYMVPSHFIKVEKIPLNTNGKVDIKALPEPNMSIDTEGEYVEPSNETEVKLAKVWSEVLGIDKIGVTEDFFEAGGDSLSAMRVIAGIFQYGWNITIQDFYVLKTIRKISDKIRGENFNCTNEKEGLANEPGTLNKNVHTGVIKDKHAFNMKTVLLTGATGFLGIHLLEKCMMEENTVVFCLVRGESKDKAEERLVELFKFYFGSRYKHLVNKRVFIVNGEITKKRFGLTEKEYDLLGKKVDTVIHSAALVKHYGEYADFKNINVDGTGEVITFCKKYGCKLAHISTVSVSGDTLDRKMSPEAIFTEGDFYIGQNYLGNVYVRSKFEAEELVFKACNDGLDAIIFRVGNLTGRYSDGHFQKNITENNFYNILRTIIEIGMIASEMEELKFEFTPIDKCSSAIVEILKSNGTIKQVFHIFNNNYIDMGKVVDLLNTFGFDIKKVPGSEYMESLKYISASTDKRGGLSNIINNLVTADGTIIKRQLEVSCKFTVEYLKSIGFDWSVIDREYIGKVIKHMKRVGYLN